MLKNVAEYKKMADVETRHWWYVSLHRMVLTALSKHRIDKSASILDAGCGTGGLLIQLGRAGYQSLRGFDLSDEAVGTCRSRKLDVGKAHLLQMGKIYSPGTVDVIISNDTLCYLSPEEQATWLDMCHLTLKPGGLVICNVPALQSFSGIHDISVGILMRFSKREISKLLASSGIRLEASTYWPFILSPPIFVVRMLQRLRLRIWPRTRIRSDIDLPPLAINSALENICRFENELIANKPFGSSLFFVARKPANPM